MEREALQTLVKWKDKPGRKPLLVKGARQVGKTYLMKDFARRYFKNVVYVNCDNDPRMQALFAEDYDIRRILHTLEIISGETITAGQTCIIIDEIQEAPRGLASLKYFCEDAPQYHVIVAGSLMGIALHKGTSFPVGKIDVMEMFPMSFVEFLAAAGKGDFARMIKTKDFAGMKIFKTELIDLLRQYYFTGGMPEAIDKYFQTRDVNAVREVQKNILTAYDNDISKHAPEREVARIRMVWRSIPAQLSKENKKFVYGLIKEGGRAKEFETAIEWLCDYGIVYKVPRVKAATMPLAMYEDFSAFKLFVLDCGLFGALCFTPPAQMLIGDNVFGTSKGAFTEQYVLEQLKCMADTPVYYWSNDKSSAEIDFVVQHAERIIPVEVKAEENLKSKSLKLFVDRNSGLKGLRLSMSDYRDQEWMENVPLYALNEAVL